MTIDLVIFDCDGVLVDTESVANDRMADYFTSLGFAITGTECRQRFQGKSLKDVCQEVSEHLDHPVTHDAVRDETYAALGSGIHAIEGVETLVETLIAQGVPVCVASSGTVDKMRMTLGQTRLLPLLENVLFSTDAVARGKPHPDVFEHAAREMGHDIRRSVIIEDSLTGVIAGIASGAQVLGYCGDPFTDADSLAAAGAMTVRDMRDVLAMIART